MLARQQLKHDQRSLLMLMLMLCSRCPHTEGFHHRTRRPDRVQHLHTECIALLQVLCGKLCDAACH